MSKIMHKGILFDSQLEVDYYEYIESLEEVIFYKYHPKVPININLKNTYTPDFIVAYEDRIEIVETKGFNPYSKLKDDMIHNVMLEKTEQELRLWVEMNDIVARGKKVVYRKIKHLKSHGFVDYDFKNPNSALNNRRNKVKEQEQEIKELRGIIRDWERYYSYQNKKLTKSQQEWLDKFKKKEGK